MASETLFVEVKEDGTRVVTKRVEDIGKAGDKSARAMGLLRTALAGLGAGATLRGIIQLGTAFTQLQNRLRVVTTGQQQLAAVTNQLFQISQRTRSSVEANAELFSRLSLATKDLGISQRQVLNFTESLNKAITISGASAQEAQAGLLQLSQGLASGTLRGDELRSVLEQLPAVADVLAQELGVTRGELRELGTQGKITTDVILSAFENAQESLSEGFNKTVQTLPQSFTQLRNAALQTVGAFNESAGVTRTLAGVVAALAQNFEILARAGLAAGIALGTKFAKDGVVFATQAVRGLTLAIAANPIGAIAIAATAAISALIAFSDRIKFGTSELVTLRDFGLAAFDEISQRLASFVNFAGDAFGIVGDTIRDVFGGVTIGQVVQNFLIIMASAFDGVIAAARGTGAALGTAFATFPRILREIMINAVNGGIGVFEGFVDQVRDLLNFFGAELPQVTFGRLENDAAGSAANVANAFREEFERSIQNGGATGLLLDIGANAAQRAAARAGEEQRRIQLQQQANAQLDQVGENKTLGSIPPTLANINRELEEQIDLLGLDAQAREIQARWLEIQAELIQDSVPQDVIDRYKESTIATLQEVQALQARAEILEQVTGAQRDFAIAVQQSQQLVADGQLNQAQGLAGALGGQDNALDLLEGTLEADQLRVQSRQEALERIAELENAQLISEQTANQLRLREDIKLSEARLSNSQKFFGTLANLQNSENKKLAAIGRAAAIVQATIDGTLAVQKALASAPPPVNFALAAAVGVVSAANIASIASQRQLGGDLNAGQLSRVGEGTRPEMFSTASGQQFLIPPERGRVTPINPETNTAGPQGGGNGGGAQVSGNITVGVQEDPEQFAEVLVSSFDTPAVDRELTSFVERNIPQIKQMLGV